jgi:ERCC4-type nuclease
MKLRHNTAPRPYKPKHWKFPDGFVMVIDTREQDRLFTRTKGLVSCVETLKDGDYSVQGFEKEIAFELKRISDFYRYIGAERERTVKKLKRLSKMPFSALVIEADLSDILCHQLFSKVHPEVARGFLTSVNVRYDIHVYTDRNRKNIERWILDRALKFYKIKRNIK